MKILYAILIVLLIVIVYYLSNLGNSVLEQDLLDQSSPVAWYDSEPENEVEIALAYIEPQNLEYLVIHTDATWPNTVWTKGDILTFFHHTRGWSRPGYAFWIDRKGVTHALWPTDIDDIVDPRHMTWGVTGKNNNSMSICFSGGVDENGKPTDTRTPEQKEALRAIVEIVTNAVPDIKIVGHRDLSPDLNGDGKITSNEWVKACPSFDVATEL
jgi:N-acetylmuramoyl-L-alanine amidase